MPARKENGKVIWDHCCFGPEYTHPSPVSSFDAGVCHLNEKGYFVVLVPPTGPLEDIQEEPFRFEPLEYCPFCGEKAPALKEVKNGNSNDNIWFLKKIVEVADFFKALCGSFYYAFMKLVGGENVFIGAKEKIPKIQLSDKLEIGDKFSANGFEFEVIGITKDYYQVKVTDDLINKGRIKNET